jgi:chromosome segregation ATPase
VKVEDERTQLVILTYRKEEITDLMKTLAKQIKSLQEKDHGEVGLANELAMKKEKLELEMTDVDDELFELEKKYGELNREPKETTEEIKETGHQIEHQSEE